MRTWVMLALLNTLWSSFSAAQAQHAKTASCQDNAFDRKVDSYLSYSVPVIGVDEAYEKAKQILFLDAREKNEYDVSHIAGARWVGYGDFHLNRLPDGPKDALIVVYCSIGYRSEKIAEKLTKAGYKRVRNLYGSLFEWVNAGYGVVDKQNQPVKKIHTYNASWSQWVNRPFYQKIY